MKEYIARRFPLALDLQLFAEGGAGGEGGEGGEGGVSGGDGGSGGSGSKTFTQAELDAAVQSRLSRAEKAAQKALVNGLGFDSVEAMQAALKKEKGSDKKDDGKLGPEDVDKLVDEKIKEREKEQNQKTFNRLLNAEVKVMANELGFADWEDARALADFSSVKENDQGELEGVREAMDDLAKKKPHLLKTKQGGGRIGADIGGGTPADKKKRQEEIINLAKSRGTIGGQAVNDPWAKN
ncbi:scaffolding protein [Paenibacillus sp. Marseille-P2973]|uniref:scaffolding protein n=1 Tax=Paenibacillus sp. Marseille-P2973 TaxID=1871032 RepID=UPI001B37E7DB|nr:scaffolding protein [Paenibacillus sp. Marseille-P2973]MBQ4899350.1 scaffolding protein [Paenibacillus sp. Marseille-P2973]